MLLGARQFFNIKRGGGLPYDAQVTYLESSGTQYIDTGLVNDRAWKIKCKYSVEGSGARNYLLIGVPEYGARRWTAMYGVGAQPTQTYIRVGTGNESGHTQIIATTTSTIYKAETDCATGLVKLDDTSYQLTSGWSATSDKLYLFGCTNTNNQPYKIYSAQFEYNGVIVQDLIPVRKGGVGYMYDKVSGALLGNQGTGAFSYGEDVKTAKDYIQDGLVLQFDGIENNGYGQHSTTLPNGWVNLVDAASKVEFTGGSIVVQDDYLDFSTNSTVGTFVPGNNTLPTASQLFTWEIVAGFTADVQTCYVFSNNTMMFRKSRATPLSGEIEARFYLPNYYNSGTYHNYVVITGDSSINHWCSVRRTMWNSTTKVDARFKRNGDSLTTTTGSRTSSGNYYVGCFGTNPQPDRNVPKFYAMRIYNRALSDAEIISNLEIDRKRFNLPLTNS